MATRLLLAVLLMFVAAEARAACDCATSKAAPWCSGNTISMSSGQGTGGGLGSAGDTMVVNFGASYTCGQYANDDFWVVGAANVVNVSSTTPNWDGTKHGWDANLAGCHHLDNRNQGRCDPVTPTTLPHDYNVAAGPVSFLKVIGRDSDSVPGGYLCHENAESSLRESCIKYSRVVTFVSAVPDSDADNSTADEFRPGLSGATKLGPYRTDMMAASLATLGSQSAGAVALEGELTFAEIQNRYSCAHWYMWKDSTTGQFPQETLPTDCLIQGAAQTDGQLTYGTNIAVFNRLVPLRFVLDDFNYAGDSTHAQALIRTVQHGLDLASQVNSGFRSRAANPPTGYGSDAAGGVWVGMKDPVAFAAFMLDQAALTTLATGRHYFESDQAYTSGVDSGVYYGVEGTADGTHSFCPDNGSGFEGGVHCYHPTKQMDAGCRQISGAPASYQSQVSNSAPFTALWVQLLSAASYWDDGTPWRVHARSWREGGRGIGHTHYLWSGGLATNGCDNQRWNTGYESPFGNEMWDTFKNTFPTSEPQITCTHDGPATNAETFILTATASNFTADTDAWLFDCNEDEALGTCVAESGVLGTCNGTSCACTCDALAVGVYTLSCSGDADPSTGPYLQDAASLTITAEPSPGVTGTRFEGSSASGASIQ